MRGSVLYAGALAAAVLAACSGGAGPQAIPGARQAPAMRASEIHVVGARPDANCPKIYSGCIIVNAASGGSILLCYGSCGPVHYQWSSTFLRRKKGTAFGKFTATFDPNPGDPVTDTVTELRHVKPSHGKYKWLQAVKVCGTGCSTGYVGIATS
ncbi:MAG: hypothetical protein WB615_11410 [Candidatus Tumulicola sp.]